MYKKHQNSPLITVGLSSSQIKKTNNNIQVVFSFSVCHYFLKKRKERKIMLANLSTLLPLDLTAKKQSGAVNHQPLMRWSLGAQMCLKADVSAVCWITLVCVNTMARGKDISNGLREEFLLHINLERVIKLFSNNLKFSCHYLQEKSM